ncbi:MAG TPA: sortase [Anaerolineales bacterium]|jgi:sortase A|nr:sortase [Anaerolineales bacterium]
MAKKVRPEDLSERELRRLLMEKKRASRQQRLDSFRRSGRLMEVSAVPEHRTSSGLDDFIQDDNLEQQKTELETRQERRKNLFDRLLFVIEIAAIAGLVFLVFNGITLIQNLNQEVSDALVQPSVTPTPLIQAVVLPSGHTPPNSEGGARFNEAEIPENLRPLHQSFASAPVPPRQPEQAIQIVIPAIGVDAPIVMGDGWEQLKQGVGQRIGSPNPGDNGNLVLSAHNDIFGQIFRDLDQLQTGDEITIYTNVKAYTYVIDKQTQVVEPTFVQVLDPTPDPTITLISCYPYLVDNKRIVIKASLLD